MIASSAEKHRAQANTVRSIMLLSHVSANVSKRATQPAKGKPSAQGQGGGDQAGSNRRRASRRPASSTHPRNPDSNLHEKGHAQNQPSQGDAPDAAPLEAGDYQISPVKANAPNAASMCRREL